MAHLTPEEIDVFKIPHSRMKELVYKYLEMVQTTNFSDVYHLSLLLENLINTFHEFIAHERIENKYIMKKLKNKLRSLSIQNTAVCNCHKDNQLTDMLSLFEDGYKCTKKSDSDRKNFGTKLRNALEDFTKTFLPHMAEEEEVFQPLLMEHFTFEELKQIKTAVIEQHFKVEVEEEKFIADTKSVKQSPCITTRDEIDAPSVNIQSIPDEIQLQIFSYLNPKELSCVSQVCRRWNNLSVDPMLWKELYPVSWANGNWSAKEGVYDEETQSLDRKLESKTYDEDADIDESDDWDAEAIEIQKQSRMLTSMCKYLLPRIGSAVQKCDLAYSKGITNGTLYKILSLCPNLEYLDLTQTRISDLGFKGLEKEGCGERLRHLDLTGCLYITDLTLQRISNAITKLPCHMKMDTSEVPVGSSKKEVQEANSDKNESSSHKEEKDSKNNTHVEKESICEQRKPCNNCEKGDAPTNQTQSENGPPHCRHGDINTDRLKGDTDKKCCVVGCQCLPNRCQNCIYKESCDKQGYRQCYDNSRLASAFGTDCGECQYEDELADMQEKTITTPCDKHFSTTHTCEDKKICHNTDVLRSNQRMELIIPSDDSPLAGLADMQVISEVHNTIPDKQDQDSDTQKLPDQVETSTGHNKQDVLEQRDADNARCEQLVDAESNLKDDDSTDFKEGKIEEMEIEQRDIIESTEIQLNPGDVTHGNSVMNDDNIFTTSHIDKHNRINTEGPDATVVVETRLDDTAWMIDTMEKDWIIDETNRQDVDNIDDEPKITQESVPYRPTSADGVERSRCLEFLGLSGCYKITDEGIGHLIVDGGLPYLRYLDLSGCLLLSGAAVSDLVGTATSLDPSNLFYCDNILDGPYAEVASGCQNLQCPSRMCCRCAD